MRRARRKCCEATGNGSFIIILRNYARIAFRDLNHHQESLKRESSEAAGEPNPTSSRQKSQRNANIAVTRITRELFGSVSSTLQHAIQAGLSVHCPSVNPLAAPIEIT